MFSTEQKQEIAAKIQYILQQVPNSELPAGEVSFILHVDGADSGSWANIRNNSARSVPVPEVLIRNMDVSNRVCPRCGLSLRIDV